MAKPRAADETDVQEAEEFLATREGLKHIRIRKRADLLILESGPSDDPLLHARLRRETVQYWAPRDAFAWAVGTNPNQRYRRTGPHHPRRAVWLDARAHRRLPGTYFRSVVLEVVS